MSHRMRPARQTADETLTSSRRAGAGIDVAALSPTDLRAANVHKHCEPGCALGCVRTVSHAVASPLASLRTSLAVIGDLTRARTRA
jgi:hypothetical protein